MNTFFSSLVFTPTKKIPLTPENDSTELVTYPFMLQVGYVSFSISEEQEDKEGEEGTSCTKRLGSVVAAAAGTTLFII
jgi:hypothetical protein